MVQMEINSRDYVERIHKMNTNSVAIVDFLRSRKTANTSGTDGFVIKDIFYPQWITKDLYDVCRRGSPKHAARSKRQDSPLHGDYKGREGGYSMLFSVTFISDIASTAFYDNLAICKGPSLGTNFTLSCPYTLLGHPFELEWAAGHGVEQGIVRVSVGLEDTGLLVGLFREALEKTESIVRSQTASQPNI